jgi:hypothetical protein
VRLNQFENLTCVALLTENPDALSIPSFQWVKINPLDNQESGDGIGRSKHFCLQTQNDKGFVLGGYVTDGKTEVPCDQKYAPFKLLNLSTYAWEREYDPARAAPYLVHPQIFMVIGGE